jgi:hypothetical protein
LTCGHHEKHGWYSSCRCCLSKSRSKIKNKTLNESNSFFRTKCQRYMKRTGCCASPHHSSSLSDCICNHPSSCRTFLCSPLFCNESDHGINHLDGDCHVVICCNCVSCFDGSHGSCNNAAGSSNHGWEQSEDEPSSSLLAAFSP